MKVSALLLLLAAAQPTIAARTFAATRDLKDTVVVKSPFESSLFGETPGDAKKVDPGAVAATPVQSLGASLENPTKESSDVAIALPEQSIGAPLEKQAKESSNTVGDPAPVQSLGASLDNAFSGASDVQEFGGLSLDEGTDLLAEGPNSDSTLSPISDQADSQSASDRELTIDNFFSNFETYQCNDANPDHEKEFDANTLNFNNLCPALLKHSTLSPIGEFDQGSPELAKYLNDDIYLPLAMNMAPRESVDELLSDVIFSAGKTTVTNLRQPKVVYDQFQAKILRLFEEMSLKSQDFDNYHEGINDLIVSALREFHLYWNQLRGASQFDKARADTREVLRVLLRSFDIKRRFLVETTAALVNKVKEAFYRFVRAHKTVEVLNSSALDILVHQMVRRYNNVVLAIRESRHSSTKLVREVDFLLRLLQLYHVVCFRKGFSESTTLEKFNTNIFLRITNNFELLHAGRLDNDSGLLGRVRDFTAVLLLKMKHLNHLMFNFHTIGEFVTMPRIFVDFNSRTGVKVYYELKEEMAMIPGKCMNRIGLKKCVTNEANIVLRYIASRYSLLFSTSGLHFYDYLREAVRNMFSRATPETWSSWSKFRHFFNVNLLAVLFNMKQRFQIESLAEIDSLEDRITALLMAANKKEGSVASLQLIDQLDTGIYFHFLDIKANFNSKTIETDPFLRSSLKKGFHQFLLDFLKQHSSTIDEEFLTLINSVDSLVQNWQGAEGPNKNIPTTLMNIGDDFSAPKTDKVGPEVVDSFQNQNGMLVAIESAASGQPAPVFRTRPTPTNPQLRADQATAGLSDAAHEPSPIVATTQPVETQANQSAEQLPELKEEVKQDVGSVGEPEKQEEPAEKQEVEETEMGRKSI